MRQACPGTAFISLSVCVRRCVNRDTTVVDGGEMPVVERTGRSQTGSLALDC